MISSLRERFPDLPDLVLWKTELLSERPVHGRAAEAVAEGAARTSAVPQADEAGKCRSSRCRPLSHGRSAVARVRGTTE